MGNYRIKDRKYFADFVQEQAKSANIAFEHFFNKAKLVPIEIDFCSEKDTTLMFFDYYDKKSKDIIFIQKQRIKFNAKKYFRDTIPKISAGQLLYLNDDSYKNSPLNFTILDSVVYQIVDFSMNYRGKEIVIPSNLTEKLLFPNFCQTTYPIKPAAAYTSQDGKFIYIYLYGENRKNTFVDDRRAFALSYVSKFIINTETREVQQLTIDGRSLINYNWLNCNILDDF